MATNPFTQTNPFQQQINNQQSNLNNPTAGAVGTSGTGTTTHHHATGGTGIILTEAGLQSSAGIPPSFVPTPEPVYTPPTPPPVNVLSSGGVKVGGVTYMGSSVVPDTGGLTANEIQAKTFSEVRQSNPNIGRGQYSAQLSYQPQFQEQVSSSLKPPTQGEILSTKGMLFLKPNEIKTTTSTETGEPSIGQRTVAQAERLLNMKEGSSGVAAITFKDVPKAIPLQDKILYSIIKSSTTSPSGELRTYIGVPDITGLGIRPAISQALTGAFSERAGFGLPGGILDVAIPQTLKGGAEFAGVILGLSELPILLGTTGTILRTGALGYFGFGGTKIALDQDLTIAERILGGAIAVGSFIGIGSDVAKLNTRYMKYNPMKEDQIVITEDKILERNGQIVREYKQYYQVEPLAKVSLTTELREYLGIKPIETDFLPREFKYRISEPVIGEGTFKIGNTPVYNAYEGNLESVGRIQPVQQSYITRYIIGGKTLNIPPEVIKGINLNEFTPSIDRVISVKYSRLTRTIVDGKPIFVEKSPFNENILLDYTNEGAIIEAPSRTFLKNLNQDDVLSLTRTVQEDKLYKIERSFGKAIGNKALRKSTIVREIGEPEIVTEITKIVQLPKFPSISEAKGLGENTIKVLEEQSAKQLAKEIEIPKQRTPFSETFGDNQIVKQEIQQSKVLTRPLPKAPIPRMIQSKFQPSTSLPRMVGGQGLSLIPFAGAGLYETQEFSSSNVNVKDNVISIQEPKIIEQYKTNIISKENLLLKQNELLKQDNLFKQELLPKQENLLKQETLQKQEILLKQVQLQKQQQFQKQNFGDYVYRRETFGEPLIPSGENKRIKRIGKKIPVYNVLLRRRGKFLPIATNLERGAAISFGSNKALLDLGRTFSIKQVGTKEIFSGFDEQQFTQNEKFRSYKIRRGKQIPLGDTWIQKTQYNLQSSEEKQQLADARKLNKLINVGF